MNFQMSETRKVLAEISGRKTDNIARAEGVAQALTILMTSYVISVVEFLMDSELDFSDREKKLLIEAIRTDTKQISKHWNDTRYITRHGFYYYKQDDDDDTFICEDG